MYLVVWSGFRDDRSVNVYGIKNVVKQVFDSSFSYSKNYEGRLGL